jgi:hypothetical protein
MKEVKPDNKECDISTQDWANAWAVEHKAWLITRDENRAEARAWDEYLSKKN